MEMLCCECFVSSSSMLVHCTENKSIQEWRAHFDQKQKAEAWLIPGRIFWLFHPWLIHQTCVTKKNIVFNHGYNPRSVPKRDLSLNRMVTVASQHVGGTGNLGVLPLVVFVIQFPSFPFQTRVKRKKPQTHCCFFFFSFLHIHTRWLDAACCCSHFHSHVYHTRIRHLWVFGTLKFASWRSQDDHFIPWANTTDLHRRVRPQLVRGTAKLHSLARSFKD